MHPHAISQSPGYAIARHCIKSIGPHVEGLRWTTDGRYLGAAATTDVFGVV